MSGGNTLPPVVPLGLSDEVKGDWSDMMKKAVEAVDIQEVTDDFREEYAMHRRSEKAAGNTARVAYTQSTHNLIIRALLGLRVMQQTYAGLIGQMIVRLRALEEKANVAPPQYRGVFREGEEYPVGTMITHGGSLWYANATTKAMPGRCGDWTLCVKRGRDGKDIRA